MTGPRVWSSWGRRVAVMAAGVVAVGVVTPVPLAGAEPPAPEVECVDVAPSEAAAVGLAAACEIAVEVLEARTPFETVWALPDGLMRAESSIAAQRTDTTGQWGPIDTALVLGPDGLRVAAPVLAMTFSDGASGRSLAEIESAGHELAMNVPFELGVPVVDGSTATYADVLPGTDLVVSVNTDGTGFSEVLRVHSPEAAADPRLAELTFGIETSDGLQLQAADGGFVAVDDAGDAVFTSPTPVMWDSAATGGVPAEGEPAASQRTSPVEQDSADDLQGQAGADERVAGPFEGDTVAPMPVEVSDDAVTITPDESILTGFGTVWPVYIDPGVSGNLNEWTAIRDAYGPDYRFDPDQGMGLCNPATTSTCSTLFKSRLIWEFNALGVIGDLHSNQVVSAVFRPFGTHSYNCADHTVEAYRVPNISSTTSWSHATAANWDELLDAVMTHHKTGCTNGPQRVEFDVTGAAVSVAAEDLSGVSIGLKARSETSMADGWKRYRHDATLSVTYNRPPNPPTGLETTSPVTLCLTGTDRPAIRDTTPILTAKITDPDGGNLQGDFNLYDLSTGVRIWDPALSPPKASGSTHERPVPSGLLVNGGSYEWRVRAVDQHGLYGSPAAVQCQFRVDLTAPVTPTVAPVAGGNVLYLEDQVSGGSGKSGNFRFTPGTSTDVVRYRYSFNSDGLGNTKDASAGAATITFTAAPPLGSQRLYVAAVDAAGNVSPTRLYRFSVGFPDETGIWDLDEGTGTTAFDSVGSPASNLTVTSTTWVMGARGAFGQRDQATDPDYALKFDSTADAASTTGPVLASNDTFTVMAFVKLDSKAATATAISQDGQFTSAFQLGYRKNAACPAGTGGECWAFWMVPDDSHTLGPITAAMSTVPVRANSWVHLTGVHDAEANTLTISVCDAGTPEEPIAAELVTTSAASTFNATWSAGGPLQIGRGKYQSAPGYHWPGTVDDVRAFESTAPENTTVRICEGQE